MKFSTVSATESALQVHQVLGLPRNLHSKCFACREIYTPGTRGLAATTLHPILLKALCTSPATKSALQVHQVLRLPRNLHCRFTKCWACHEVCARFTKCCACHEIYTTGTRGPAATTRPPSPPEGSVHHSSHTSYTTQHRSSHTPPLTTHHTPLISHHSSHTTHHTPLISHHSFYTTPPLITHRSPHSTHHTPLIVYNSSHTTHLTPLITHHSSHTTYHTALISFTFIVQYLSVLFSYQSSSSR